LFYYSLYSNPASGYSFNYVAQEFVFDHNKLTVENAKVELNKTYAGLKRWLYRNRVKKKRRKVNALNLNNIQT